MGALTETEIFDQMTTSFRLAIELSDRLAREPLKGENYDKFRRQLRLIEGCCKQANTWREDTRWLVFVRLMGETHQRAGDWLRGIPDPMTGRRIKLNEGTLHPAFVMLANNLRALMKLAEQIRDQATGHLGMILPDALPGAHRDTRPVGWNRSAAGLIVPSGVAAQ